MNQRRIVALNLTVGTFVLAAAGVHAVGGNVMGGAGPRVAVEALVQQIVRQEKQHMVEKDHYEYFLASDQDRVRGFAALSLTPPPAGNYAIEAFSDRDNALVVRAYTLPRAIASGEAAAVLYEHRIRIAGEDGQGRWVVGP
ncbi:MAG: hypothetical protein ABT940_02905 [Alphaproteobacteria bacterium]